MTKNLMQRSSFFIKDFKDFYKIYYVTSFFDRHTLWQWYDGSLKIFQNFHGNAFCFFVFPKWKKYYNFTFDDTLKMYWRTHYANLNSKSINKLYLRPLNMLFRFFLFWFFIYGYFKEVFALWKNYHFVIQISRIYFKI